ncbi:HAD hydrolase-like protein [Faecalibacterium sp. An122]|uniref:HAD family hydrolase n=1 Tax=Faecalibacterium sp. An122 TaxID=1965551 RepID=UPI000B3864C6|nr:HAD hydrolase-like protein [Faecalibacterium sp. An122]OUQ35669.1 hypothetical protein B5E67_11785 [Faecalibacterium sp. An122]
MDYKKLTYKTIVLDFDGTVCRLFAHYDLQHTKRTLEQILPAYGVDFNEYDDCFDVYHAIRSQLSNPAQRIDALSAADRIIEQAECEAIDTCTDIPGLDNFLKRCGLHHIQLGIATNNSPKCVLKYWKRKGLTDLPPIVGRDISHIEHLKPDPWSLNKVIETLHTPKNDILFIGDSPTDYECAVRAQVDFLGITATEKKQKRFETQQISIPLIKSYDMLWIPDTIL